MASRYKLDRYKCALLQQIIDRTGAKIVVSSSWRSGSAEETIADLKDTSTFFKPFTPSWVDEIVGVTIRAYAHIKKGVHLDIPRGVEIKQWIDTHLHRDEEGHYHRKKVGEDFQYIILTMIQTCFWNTPTTSFIPTLTSASVKTMPSVPCVS